MTKSQMFQTAHAGAKADCEFDKRYSYAYYFRLHLLVLQREAREQKTGMCIGFQIVDGRIWA